MMKDANSNMPRYIPNLEESTNASLWLAKFADLRLDSDPQRQANVAERFSPELAEDARCLLAPYKPLLLFCVLDEFEAGQLGEGSVFRDAELVFRYESYFSLVVERCGNKPDLRMPFHALGGDQVWACFSEDGKRSETRDTTRRCVLASGLLTLWHDGEFRKKLRHLLIETYFPPHEQIGIAAALNLVDFNADEAGRIRMESKAFLASQQRGRDARFRVDVVTRYRFTCALTGYRLTTEQANIVEAAHIVPWSRSRDDDPRNGLALTPNAHWMFDRGLWSVDGSGLVVVKSSSEFSESSPPSGFLLRYFTGRPLFFRDGCTLRPDSKRLAEHRRYHFEDEG